MSNTVLLVDDHELIRQGLRQALERAGDFIVVAEAATLTEARDKVRRFSPQVVITDQRLNDGLGTDLARELRSKDTALGIVILTMYAGDETLFAAMESGASALVSKEAPSAEVVAAARQAVVSPRSFASRDLGSALKRRLEPSSTPTLSPREQAVLELLAEGMGVSAIARHMYISESTAKTHLSRIYDKLGAANRAQALMTAVRSGLLPMRA